MEEDLTLRTVSDVENRQSLIYGIGDQQLEVVVSKLLARYKVDMVLSKPKFAFRETLRKKVEVQGKYKKQSGGHGQYGDVKMEFEPSGDLEKHKDADPRGRSVPRHGGVFYRRTSYGWFRKDRL
jgi:elongation factor G